MPSNPNWENPVTTWALSNGYAYPPDQAINTPSFPSNGQGPSVTILEPGDGSTITKSPFVVNVNAISQNPIARVDLSINGELYQSITVAPFIFTVNKNLTDGSYTLAAHAVDSTGAAADTSATINLSVSAPLTLTQPTDQSLLQFPVSLIAASNDPYGSVSFYYQTDKGQTKLIGQAQNIDHTDQYHYTFNWTGPLPAGNYKIYAQSNNNIVSRKVQISVP